MAGEPRGAVGVPGAPVRDVSKDIWASDLHITVASPPAFRVRGHIQRAEEFDLLTADDTRGLLYRIQWQSDDNVGVSTHDAAQSCDDALNLLVPTISNQDFGRLYVPFSPALPVGQEILIRP